MAQQPAQARPGDPTENVAGATEVQVAVHVGTPVHQVEPQVEQALAYDIHGLSYSNLFNLGCRVSTCSVVLLVLIAIMAAIAFLSDPLNNLLAAGLLFLLPAGIMYCCYI